MLTYAEKYVVESEDVGVLRQIKQIVDGLNVPDLGFDEDGKKIELSCHMLAEVISELFGLKCINGYYMLGYNHSWVVTNNGHIIDVYPVGIIGGPLLVSRQIIHKNGPIYIEDNALDFGQNKPYYKKAIDLIEDAVLCSYINYT